MNANIRKHIMGAKVAATAAPAEDEDARHDQNVEKASDSALQLFYDENSHNDLMNMIPDGDFMGGVAVVASTLIQAVDEQSGGNMPDDVIFPAAMDVMGELMDYLDSQGIHTFSEKDMGLASTLLMKKLADDYGTTPEQMAEALKDLQQSELDGADATYRKHMLGEGNEAQEASETPKQEAAETEDDGDEKQEASETPKQEAAETEDDGDEKQEGLMAKGMRG